MQSSRDHAFVRVRAGRDPIPTDSGGRGERSDIGAPKPVTANERIKGRDTHSNFGSFGNLQN